jgi:hypothetical protein
MISGKSRSNRDGGGSADGAMEGLSAKSIGTEHRFCKMIYGSEGHASREKIGEVCGQRFPSSISGHL